MFTHTDGRTIGSWMMLAGVALLAGPLHAQPASPAPAAPMQARITEIQAPAGNAITLYTGRGMLIDVNKPLKRAAVGDPNVADVSIVSPQQVMVSGKVSGTTNLVLWDGDGGQIVYDVAVRPDVGLLRAAIAETAPGSQVEVTAVGDKIILRGTVPDVDTADRIVQIAELFTSSSSTIAAGGGAGAQGGDTAVQRTSAAASGGSGPTTSVVNHLIVAGEHQVLLRCTVAEVTKSATRSLGINGWLAGDNVRDVFAVNQIAGINPVNIGGAPTANIIQPGGIPFATDVDGLPLTSSPEFSLGFPRVQMQLFFRAMRENRLLRVLAEPNLVALSGHEASFLAGGEFPTVAAQGVSGTTIAWREYGVRLRFTPTVLGRQIIRLRVAPEVSDLDPTTGINTPEIRVPFGLTQRRAETTIELASGSTIALAGLLNERVRGISQKIPALGDVPVLGMLFSSVNYQKDITELVIFVTPEVVASLQPDQVDPVPGQLMKDPNDWQLYGLGMIEGEPAREDADPAEAIDTKTPARFPKVSSPPEQMSLHGPWGQSEAAEVKK